MIYKYTIPGDPIAWARAQVSFTSRRFYNGQKNERLVAGIYLQNQHDQLPLFEGPLRLDIICYLPIPKTKQRKDGTSKLEGQFVVTKPDKDNLDKHIADTATRILFKDDCLICAGDVMKVYSMNPRTELYLQRLPKFFRFPERLKDAHEAPFL